MPTDTNGSEDAVPDVAALRTFVGLAIVTRMTDSPPSASFENSHMRVSRAGREDARATDTDLPLER